MRPDFRGPQITWRSDLGRRFRFGAGFIRETRRYQRRASTVWGSSGELLSTKSGPASRRSAQALVCLLRWPPLSDKLVAFRVSAGSTFGPPRGTNRAAPPFFTLP